MQALSYMRRSRFNLRPFISLLLFAAVVVYESIGTVYLYLTPMLGTGFYLWRKYYQEKEYYYPIMLFFIYTLYFEIDRDMILFSFILLALIYHYFLASWFESSFNCDICLRILYVTYAYLGYFVLNLFMAFIFNQPLPVFDTFYMVYIIADFIIVVLLP